jgi:TolA-binding protein
MLTLVNILALFFIIIISYQLILANHIVEGLTNENKNTDYKPYDSKDPMILAQQNAGNIEFLKQRMDSLQNMNQIVQDLSGNVQALQQQVNGLVTTQQQYATQMTGGEPPNITGATNDDNVDTSDLVTE